MSAEPASGSVPARRGRPGYDQATVLRRAIDVFNRQGYDATSMGDLARELGLTKSAIYHHVPSKEHLLAAALDEALDALDSTVTAIAATSRQPAEARLRAAIHSSVEILVDHLPAVTLLLRARGNSEVEQAALERRRAIDGVLADLVRDACREGTLRDDIDPELISRLLFGMVNSSVEWFHPGGSVDARVLADAITGIAFDGLTRG
ncbi:TetR/AcrR family transcriptional regulator [Nocardioides piscis]|uniref:TetR/AcrR family transcriptional regulator n=1 Tax=Nocardioides piscis TaxID=2714938 RepID=A0A6G7YGQ5_9ACTN|nr:TetR/AcrR family transcriptional regulator [Nocardioides piscis]QIK75856.1 TetR/AcrR family transcriptional regulator [Nocardioides piscis]